MILELKNQNGLSATLTDYGQRLMALNLPDKNGKIDNVVLGYKDPKDYLKKEPNYYGAFVGRYCNRIAEAQFKMDDKIIKLTKNNTPNHLHGGKKGFASRYWDVLELKENTITFSGISNHGEEGYPGNLSITVKYTLTDNNVLRIEYKAHTDSATPVNLTHHSFFNLKGEGCGTIYDHDLYINADTFLPIRADGIPIGHLEKVNATPLDFRKPKKIGRDILSPHSQLSTTNGYDHTYAINKSPKDKNLCFAAKVHEPSSGRTMELYTDMPGVQLYTSNFLDGTDSGESGKPYIKHGALCLETQFFPDSPNQPDFPNTILKPEETWTSITEYRFGIEHGNP